MMRKRLLLISRFMLFSFLLGLLSIAGLYLYVRPSLPDVAILSDFRYLTPLRIYSEDGKLIGEFGEKKRAPIQFEQIPELYIKALLAIEDTDFYSHHGVSIRGIVRSAINNIRSGRIKGGGSTVTMQVARNAFPEKIGFKQTYLRKIKEVFLALEMERKLTKNQILELYVNQIYLGNRSYGIQAAAKTYYGVTVDQLNLAQLATIVGTAKSPMYRNPLANPDRARERRNYIIKRMLSLNYINQSLHDEMIAEPTTAKYHGLNVQVNLPYVAELAREKVVAEYGQSAYTSGLKVITTVDSQLQRSAINAVLAGLKTYDRRHGYRGPELDWRKKFLRDSGTENMSEEGYADILTQLQEIQSFGKLEPAVIVNLSETHFSVLLKNSEVVQLDWERGLGSWRHYISKNKRGSKLNRENCGFAVGDVIRLEKKADGWQLAQLPEVQGALVSLRADDGAIRSVIGGFDFGQSAFNRAVQAKRQPGSSLKPFLYASALEKNYSPASRVNDSPIYYSGNAQSAAWRPKNDGGSYLGNISMREALYRSRNMASIRLLRDIGINTFVDNLTRYGFDTDAYPRNLSLALGSQAVSPLELAEGYAVIANGGFEVNAFLISQILDQEGKPLFNRLVEMAEKPKVMDEQTVFLIDSMLKDVIKKGTGKKALSLKRADIAGKTGTTNGPVDAWFSGYHPRLVTTVWVGFDRNAVLGDAEYGGSAALPIWIDYMASALESLPLDYKTQPKSVVALRVNRHTGELSDVHDSDAVFEYFQQRLLSKGQTKGVKDHEIIDELFN